MNVLSSRRSSSTALLVLALLGVVSSTQPWLQFTIDPSVSFVTTLEVPGIDAQPLAFTLFLALGAGVFAMVLASGWVQVVVFALLAILGGASALASAQVLSSPTQFAGAELAQILGFSDAASIDAATTSAATTAWVGLCVALGVLSALVALLSIHPSRTWTPRARRYDRAGRGTTGRRTPSETGATTGSPPEPSDRIDDWDALTEGTDPTS